MSQTHLLIPNRELPRCCMYCPCQSHDGVWNVCRAFGEGFPYRELNERDMHITRPDWCELEVVPEASNIAVIGGKVLKVYS